MTAIKREYANGRECNRKTDNRVENREEYGQRGEFGPLTYKELLNFLLLVFGAGLVLGVLVTFVR